jgi:hypothetical protein
MDEQAGQLLRLREHLQQVQNEPSIPLDEKLLDTAIYALAPTLSPDDTQALILQIYQLLPELEQDPTPVIRLLSRLLEPVPLANILSLEPPVDFISGLQVAAVPFNTLTLSLLEKADANSARTLASAHPQLFVALVELWLGTQDEGVADKAGRVLVHLLRVDIPDSSTVGLDGSVWKRMFRDKNVYERIFAITDSNTGKDTSLSRSRKTVAQARLLDWLPAVGSLNWSSITQSYHPEIEASFGLPSGQRSLLDYAASRMVDYKHDVLMHRTLMASFEALLKINPSNSLVRSPALEFLARSGLHRRTLNYYIAPDDPSHDPLDVSFLYGPAAMYTARWTETYPHDLEDPRNAELKRMIFKKTNAAVSVPAARWAHAHSPSEDLHVLSSLPRAALLSLGPNNPVLSIPSRAANTDALNCLATIFHGPLEEPLTVPAQASKPNEAEEIKAAQALYQQYITRNDRLWSDVITHADTVALKDQALAAINLIKAVITARWDGIDAIMEGPAKASVVPWLLSPPKTFSNLVGGHGDAENAAYKIAMAKFDALKAFWNRIKTTERYADIAKVAEERVREGPWARDQEVGARIGTLEL